MVLRPPFLISYVLCLRKLLRSLPITVPVPELLRLLVVLWVALSAVELHAAIRLHVPLRRRSLPPLGARVGAKFVLVLNSGVRFLEVLRKVLVVELLRETCPPLDGSDGLALVDVVNYLWSERLSTLPR